MNSGLFKVYEDTRHQHKLTLDLGHSSIVDWHIVITSETRSKEIVNVQECDLDFALAKAEVELKEWLIKNKGGY